jgi:hypothetical protein
MSVTLPPDRAKAWREAYRDSTGLFHVRTRVTLDPDTLEIRVLEAHLLPLDANPIILNEQAIAWKARPDAATGTTDAVASQSQGQNRTQGQAQRSGTPERFAILGVRLGDPIEAAVNKVRAELESPRTYRLTREANPEAQRSATPWAPLYQAWMVTAADGSDTTVLYHGPLDGTDRVIAASRGLLFPEGSGPPAPAVQAQLRQTYGDEARELSDYFDLMWQVERTVPDQAEAEFARRGCRRSLGTKARLLAETFNASRAAPEGRPDPLRLHAAQGWTPTGDAPPLSELKPAKPIHPRRLIVSNAPETCPITTLTAFMELHAQRSVEGLFIVLSDPALAARSEREAHDAFKREDAASSSDADVEIKF